MSIQPGHVLAHYEILEPIGKGGMGEVYRARDTKLGRDVAIKVLPADVYQDGERLARFEREARVLASLNHPNVASIHGIEEEGGVTGIVLELVTGSTLAERIQGGALSVDEAIGIARQVVEAMEYAHERGVIHRDLKPANVKLTDEGQVKVLDFGLAKALGDEETAPVDDSLSPTLTRAGTQVGILLGTAGYMAPEQAKGKTVDKRGDIWAFGVVLFEMLTGERLYTGETASETLASVIKEEPDWRRLPAICPPHVRRLLERCLTKDPKERLRDIGEARIALNAKPESRGESNPSPVRRVARAFPWVVAAGLAAALWMSRTTPTPAVPSTRFSFSVPPNGFRTGDAGPFTMVLAVSPDGSRIVYSATLDEHRRSDTQLFVRSLDELDAIPLPNTEGANAPFFSPDGRFVAFARGGRLRRVPVEGGSVATIAELNDARFLGAVWSSSGDIIFAESGIGLERVPASGGVPEVILPVDEAAGEIALVSPDILPGDEHVVFAAAMGAEEPSEIRVLSLEDGSVRKLLDGAAYPRFAAPGHLLFVRNDLLTTGIVHAVAFDGRGAVVTGAPFAVQENVAGSRGGLNHFAVSANGALVYVPNERNSRTVVAVRRDGSTDTLVSETGDYRAARFSPDGRRLLLQRYPDVWVYDRVFGTLTRITNEGSNFYPTWTPDGERVTIATMRSAGDDRDLYWAPADGSGVPEILVDMDGEQRASAWSPDGRFLAFNINEQSSAVDGLNTVWLVELGSGDEPRQFHTGATAIAPAISPDGRFIAYTSSLSGRFEIYVQTFPEPGPRVQVSANGGTEPVWSRDGTELFFRSDEELMSVVVDTNDGFTVRSVAPLFDTSPYTANAGFSTYDVAPDGSHFAMVKLGSEGTRVVVVLDWLSEFEALAPTSP